MLTALSSTTVTRGSLTLWVYQALTPRQVRGGHEHACWYFREVSEDGNKPQSCAYDSRSDAIDAARVDASEGGAL